MPQILINREPLRHMTFDVELLGDCDVIINELCLRLGDDWSAICTSTTPAREIRHGEMSTPPPDSASTPHAPNSDSSNIVGASTVDNNVTRTADSTDAETPKAQADVAASTVNTDDSVRSAGASVSKDGSSCPSETGAAATAAETSSSHPPSLAAGLQGTVLLHCTSVYSSALYLWPTQEPNVVGADVIASPSL